MDLYVLNADLAPIAVVDQYESLIWSTRYYTYGDFELYLPADRLAFTILLQGYYLKRSDSDRIMMIKNIGLDTDVENGDHLTVKGFSAEKILHQRIVWSQTNLNGNAESELRRVINENVISPSNASRKISNFILAEAVGYSEAIKKQTTGAYVDEVTTDICTTNKWGWKVTLNNKKQFVFSLYSGKTKGVTFSPNFDNLISSNYQSDKSNFANVALVAGEGEGTARKTAVVGTASGLDRYEMFVDARDVSTNEGEISESEYKEVLNRRGLEKLNEALPVEAFDSEVDPNVTYKYKEDYDIGDVVTVVNEYGIKAESRIIEIVECFDSTGYSVVPTFEKWSV